MKTFIDLFTSPTCPYCPGAKAVTDKVVGELNAKGEELVLSEFDISTAAGMAKAREYGVTHVPDIVIYVGSGRKVSIEGAPKQASLERAIEMAQGKVNAVEKKERGFLSKLGSALGL